MDKPECLLTIITPTYNRGEHLENLFASLKKQSLKLFEWILVDDGSTDDTHSRFLNWEKENPGFEMTYLKKQNGGKHTALNLGIPAAKYEFIYVLDSDDTIVEDAVDTINNWVKHIRNNSEFAGVAGLRRFKSSQEIIGEFPKNREYVDSSNIDRRKNKLRGDKAEVYKRDLLIEHPFPVFENEKYVPEAIVFDQIAIKGYKLRWFNKVISEGEYLEGGITKGSGASNSTQNIKANFYYEKIFFESRPFPQKYVAVLRLTDYIIGTNYSHDDIKNFLGLSSIQLKFTQIFKKILLVLNLKYK